MNHRYVEAAQRYMREVASGAVPACKWTKLAVDRQLQDLERPLSSDWPYVFDAERAERPCKFIELLPHIKGKWAREGRLIELEDWQCFIITTVFGWVHHATRLRRFKEGYVEVPRKNAKSTLSSGLALYMLSADGEQGAEVYSAATTRDQARIVFDDSKAMADRVSGLRAHLGVVVLQHSITVAATSSKYTPLAAEGSTLDGLNVHFAVIDELHAHKNRAVYDVIDTARGAREQSLLWNITTAGTDRSGICYERRTHTTKVLERVIDDPAIFGIIYTIDDTDDPFQPASWAKANPNWGKSVLEDDMVAAARKAEAMPSALANFLTKRLNVWVSYNNTEQANKHFLDYTLLAYLTRIEASLNTCLLEPAERAQGMYFEFDVNNLLRGDSTQRADYYLKMRQAGGISQNEIRQRENMPLVDGADDLHVPLNMAPSDMLRDYFKKDGD